MKRDEYESRWRIEKCYKDIQKIHHLEMHWMRKTCPDRGHYGHFSATRKLQITKLAIMSPAKQIILCLRFWNVGPWSPICWLLWLCLSCEIPITQFRKKQTKKQRFESSKSELWPFKLRWHHLQEPPRNAKHVRRQCIWWISLLLTTRFTTSFASDVTTARVPSRSLHILILKFSLPFLIHRFFIFPIWCWV